MKKYTILGLIMILITMAFSVNAQVSITPIKNTSVKHYFNTSKGLMYSTYNSSYSDTLNLYNNDGTLYKSVILPSNNNFTWAFCSDKLFNDDATIEIMLGYYTDYTGMQMKTGTIIIDEDAKLLYSFGDKEFVDNPDGKTDFGSTITDNGRNGSILMTRFNNFYWETKSYSLPGHYTPVKYNTDTVYVIKQISFSDTLITKLTSASIIITDTLTNVPTISYTRNQNILNINTQFDKLDVYNMLGQRIDIITSQTIDLSKYASGSYILYIRGYVPLQLMVTK